MRRAPRQSGFAIRFHPLVSRDAHPVSTRFKAHCALLACSLLWGATFVIVKNALADISVFAYLAARFILGALPMAWIYRSDLRKLSPGDIRAGLIVGLCMAGGYAFQTAGIARTSPSKAAFITGFSVVLIPVFLAIFWRRKINAWAWGGALASFAGLYFLTVPRQGIGDLNRGDLLVMGCAVLYALQIIFIERYSATHSLAGLSFLQVAVTASLSLLAVPILNVTGLGNVPHPLHIPDVDRRSAHRVFHYFAGLSAPGLGAAPHHGHEYGADTCQRTGICRHHFLCHGA